MDAPCAQADGRRHAVAGGCRYGTMVEIDHGNRLADQGGMRIRYG
jgi:hypothetical protein